MGSHFRRRRNYIRFHRRLNYTIPRKLHSALRAAGIVLEPMDTGAACRTYNVLVAEDRHVAAALLPLS